MSDRSCVFPTLESKWQAFWASRDLFAAVPGSERPKFYCYTPAPYVTGKLHVGHVRNYTYGDFLAKYKRLQGANVLYTIGFDAFGLPTELASIRTGRSPAQWVEESIESMQGQLRRLGFGFDWRRSFATSDPSYYRWTQWVFLRMWERGLVYRREGKSDWCPQCDVAVARSQVDAGCCQMCDTRVESRRVRQWFFRISAYAGRLHDGLDQVRDLNGLARAGQLSLLAPRAGWGVRVRIPERDWEALAFLDSADRHGKEALALVIHMDDEETIRSLGLDASQDREEAATPERPPHTGESRSGSTRTPLTATHGRHRFPVFLSPGLDPVFSDQPVLVPWEAASEPSALPARSPAPVAKSDGAGMLDPDGDGLDLVPLTIYRQKDFSVSRQRLWGTPIPIVLCEECGEVPVPESGLPVLVPAIEESGGRLVPVDGDVARARACPSCGRDAELESQVMDCHFDALWHYCRPCLTSGDAFPFDDPEVRHWLPVDRIIFGRDTIPFLLDLRAFMKFLCEEGYCADAEFARETLAHGMILRNGRKMSKHLGNVVEPEEVAGRFGADSLRFFVMARGNPKSDYDWSDVGVRRYMDLLGSYCALVGAAACDRAGLELEEARGPLGKYDRVLLKKFFREAEALEIFVESGRFDHYARSVARLLGALDVYWAREYARTCPAGKDVFWKCLEQVTIYLAPIAPHIGEECWERLGHEPSVFDQEWPRQGVAELKTRAEGNKGDAEHETRSRMQRAQQAH